MDAEIDVYELLGISIEANEKEITKAYRIKALQYHPDKNRDNPDAAKVFHDVKSAYDLLSDPKQRGEYDERQRARLAKRQRQNALSSQRKRMKSQLERDERAARSVHVEQQAREQQVREEAARFRDEALKAEWRRDKQMREHVRQAHAAEEETAQHAQHAAEVLSEADELDRTIRVRWDGEQTHHSPESLRAVFLQFGELEEVVVAPVSASNARRRGTGARPASALVVFRSIAAAHALMHVQHAGPDIQSFERFWARGAEPESVRSTISNHRFVPAADSSTINLTRRRSKRIPDISAIDLRQIPGNNLGFADFEALTLMRMRQSVAAGSIQGACN
ncbi:hypothetical protein GGF45_004754 [Coemansia sp. RSA 551]|nr:hypothetical protein GGF45_004754 [Coemansia sp. RSA 551]